MSVQTPQTSGFVPAALVNLFDLAPTQGPAAKPALKVSEDGMKALFRSQGARAALADGRAAAAADRIAAAQTALETEEVEMLVITEPKVGSDQLLPINMSVLLGNDFEPSGMAEEALRSAAALIRAGEEEEAFELLCAEDLDLYISLSMLPLAVNRDRLAKAAKLTAEGALEGAASALEALEASVVTRAYPIRQLPSQGLAR